MEKKLTATTVFMAKSEKRGSKARPGFKDEAGQVFVPPLSSKRVSAWKKKLEDKGYTFA